MQAILDQIRSMSNSVVSECDYNENHEMLSKKTKRGSDSFIETTVTYDSEKRVGKSVASVYFGNGMKKKHLSDAVTVFTYNTLGSVDLVWSQTKVENKIKGTTILKNNISSEYDRESGISKTDELEYDDNGKLMYEHIIQHKGDPDKPIMEEHYSCNGEDDRTLMMEKHYYEETKTTKTYEYSSGKQDRIVEVSYDNDIDIPGFEDSYTLDFLLGDESKVTCLKDVGRKGTLLRTNKSNNVQDTDTEYTVEELFEKNENDKYVLISKNLRVKNKDKNELIKSVLYRPNGYTIVVTPVEVIINSNEADTSIVYTKKKDKVILTYNFIEQGTDTYLEYIDGKLEKANGLVKIDDIIYYISLDVITRMARVKVTAYNSNNDMLSDSTVIIDTENEEEYKIFYNLFNLLVKSIRSKYGEDCIDIKNPSNPIAVSGGTFEDFFKRYIEDIEKV